VRRIGNNDDPIIIMSTVQLPGINMGVSEKVPKSCILVYMGHDIGN
jgi:hypothetical protein